MRVRKVFIYNGKGGFSLSSSDLKTLFSSEKIFNSHPDVMMSDFDFSMDGLTHPVFVVPGGSTSLIGGKLKPQIDIIKTHFKENYSYVGICAGAFLGASDGKLFYTSHKVDKDTPTKFAPVLPMSSTQKKGFAFDVFENYQAIGSFYPDQNYLGNVPHDTMPYCVPITLNRCQKTISQLYLQGPALYSFPSNEAKSSNEEVVATFVHGESYKKNNPHLSILADNSLAAIVRTPPQANIGGKLLSCVHFEACVPDSQTFKFFQCSSKYSPALSKEVYDLLASEQEKSLKQIEALLKDTLKVIPS